MTTATIFDREQQYRMAQREFYQHSYTHKRRDPDNCAACALQAKDPNYAGWPLIYIAISRPMNKQAFGADLAYAAKENLPYFDNVRKHLEVFGHPGYVKDKGGNV